MDTLREYRRRTIGTLPGQAGAFAILDAPGPFDGAGLPRSTGRKGQVSRSLPVTLRQSEDVRLLSANVRRSRVTITNNGDPSQGSRDDLFYSFSGKATSRSQRLRAGQSVTIDRSVPRGELWGRLNGTWGIGVRVQVVIDESSGD